MDLDDCVFTVTPGAWQIRVLGQVLPTTWSSRGAARAALQVERERLRRKQSLKALKTSEEV